ncbi:hypothetical protein [Streptomyces coffeae]|uniref:DUF4337 domain-containing protein n=1 Tax=Streptomyces coffeae TaxID=621382 RepID=A0ABS1NNB7_9ACTN|nr:hypothetical protein [Streptomyces coffeae]MBL1101601.1 hypothetical protein [Streptomyces coffeae]
MAATLLATWQFKKAGDCHQNAVAEELRLQAAVQEEARYVYADEAPLAFRVAAASSRAEALKALKDDGRLAASEFTLAEQETVSLRHSAGPGSIIGSDRYLDAQKGYDVPRRLAHEEKNPAAYRLAPDRTMEEGDRWAAWGRVSLAVAAAAILAVMAAASVLRPAAWQFPPSTGGSRRLLRGIDPIPQPATASSDRRRGTQMHLLVAVLLFLLPLLQLAAASNEQRAQAEASRQALRLGAAIVASGQREAFLTQAVTASQVADIHAAAREVAVLYEKDSPAVRHERAVAAAETRHASQLRVMAEYMGRAPSDTDGVSAASVAALRARPEDWPDMRAEQNRYKALADAAGDRGLYLAAATALAVVAEVLADAFLEAGRLSRMGWPAGIAALSIGITAWTVLS